MKYFLRKKLLTSIKVLVADEWRVSHHGVEFIRARIPKKIPLQKVANVNLK